MDERPAPPPEGLLIAEALTHSGMSIREASRRAGISYGRWRQITSGVQNVSPGSYARVRAPADTLARMARTVNITPAELAEAGREDAAAILTGMPAPETGTHGHAVTGLTQEEAAQVRAFIEGLRTAAARRAAPKRPRPARESRE